MFPNGREAQMGGDVYIPMADSHWGLTENSKICNYPSIKNINLIKKNFGQNYAHKSIE